MENIIKRYTLDEVFEVIDKHIRNHEAIIEESRDRIILCCSFGKYSQIDKYSDEINDSASAIASLVMLKNELEGKVEY